MSNQRIMLSRNDRETKGMTLRNMDISKIILIILCCLHQRLCLSWDKSDLNWVRITQNVEYFFSGKKNIPLDLS